MKQILFHACFSLGPFSNSLSSVEDIILVTWPFLICTSDITLLATYLFILFLSLCICILS